MPVADEKKRIGAAAHWRSGRGNPRDSASWQRHLLSLKILYMSQWHGITDGICHPRDVRTCEIWGPGVTSSVEARKKRLIPPTGSQGHSPGPSPSVTWT
eukprot:scaffold4309_cov215-Pinguiococcus_pyrenoidosus.AAC.5